MLRGAIFDFDGILVDSEATHFEVLRTTLWEEAGLQITLDEYTKNYLACDDRECIRRALTRHGRDSGSDRVGAMAERKERAFADRLSRIALLPGAEALVLALHAEGIPLAVASSARRHEVETLLRSHDLRAAFRGIVSAEDVDCLKPHPEPYLRARTVVGAGDSPRGVVAFEDSIPGLASARAAGLRVIGVTNSHPREKLGLAHRVVESLSELTVADIAAVAAGI